MRTYKFSEHIKNKSEFTRKRLRLISSQNSAHLPSTKQRSKEEEYFLIRLDLERWKKWQRDGRIEIKGKGKYKMGLKQ